MRARQHRPSRPARGLARATLLRALAVLAGLALLWTLAVGWALPRLAQPRIEAAASAALGAPFKLGELKIAPWSLGVGVSNLRLGPPEAEWLKVTRVEAQLSIESLWRLAPVLRRVSVHEPQLQLERLDAGRLNITPMLDALARQPPAPHDSKPARFAVHNIRVEDGRIDFFDRVAKREHHVEALQIGVPFISNLPSKLGVDVEPLLDARIDGSRLRLQGKTQPFNEGQRSSIAIDWQQLDLARWAQALGPLLPQPLPFNVTEGEGASSLQVTFERHGGDAPPALRITGGVQISKLRAALPGQGLQLAWEGFAVEGLDLQPFERRASVAAVSLVDVMLMPLDASRRAVTRAGSSADRSGDQLTLRRIDLAGLQASSSEGAGWAVRAGSLVLDALDFQATRRRDAVLAWLPPRRPSAPVQEAPTPEASPSPMLRWRLDELRCVGCALGLVDESVQPVARMALTRSDLSLRGLSDDLSQPLAFDFTAQTGPAGRIKFTGTARPAPLQVRSRVELAALDLRVLQPYLRPHVNLDLATAKLGAAGDVLLEGSTTAPLKLAQWRGRVALADVRALDSLNRADLLRLKSLQVDGADVAWRSDAPLQADLGAVALQGFYGRVIVNADGRLNLLDIARREGQGGPRSLTTPHPSSEPASTPAAAPPALATSPAPSAAPSASTAAARPQLRWRSIALAGGAIDFTDNFIRPNYSAKLTDLAGSVAALAWNDPQPAAITLAGKVDGSAPLEISGSVHPLGARLATDITASARGIDITRLTGYSGRYAGYGIEKGSLSVKVRYRIEGGTLEAENNLYLDQLTFGDKVDSPDALKLPVLLAVSLLKDRNGVIDLNLPISGSLDDPQFSIGGVIVKVIVNLIAKAVTAPFALLASAFGGSGGQELGHVSFAAGSTDLSDAARQTLDTLAKALNDRPALRLEATGHADSAGDEAALRAQHALRLMRAAKAKSTGELADSVTIYPAERPRWIEAAYKAADLKDKPRNALGLSKGLPVAEMETLLQKSAAIDEAALKALADDRGDRVKAYLVTQVAPQRVLLTASKLGALTAAEGAAGAAASSVVFALK